jgi:uncharacterized membrane protein
MNIELKLLIYWLVLTGVLYAIARVHFAFSNSNYTWKYFSQHYSLAGALYGVSLYAGLAFIASYALIKATIWWFK